MSGAERQPLDGHTTERLLDAFREADFAEVERVVNGEGPAVLLRPFAADPRPGSLPAVCAMRMNPREQKTLEGWLAACFDLGLGFPANLLTLRALLENRSFDVASRVRFLREFSAHGVDVSTPAGNVACVYSDVMGSAEPELVRAISELEISEAARVDAVVAALHRLAYWIPDSVERAKACIAVCPRFDLVSRVMPAVLPLHAAALSGSMELLLSVLEGGADVLQELPDTREQRLLLPATRDPRGNGAMLSVSAGLSAMDTLTMWRRGLEGAAQTWAKSKKRDLEAERRSHYLEFCAAAHGALLERGAVPTPQTLSGLSLVVSGEIAGFPRDAAERRLERLGADVASGVTKRVNALLCGVKPGASKLKKAEALGIPVVSHTETLRLLAGRPWLQADAAEASEPRFVADPSHDPAFRALGEDEWYHGFRTDEVSAFLIAGLASKEPMHSYAAALECARSAARLSEVVLVCGGALMYVKDPAEMLHCPMALGVPLLRVDASDDVPSAGMDFEKLTTGIARARSLLEGLADDVSRLSVEFESHVGLYLACCGPLGAARLVFGEVREDGSGPDYFRGKNMLQDVHAAGVLGISLTRAEMGVEPIQLDAAAHREHLELIELLGLAGGHYHLVARHT